MHRGATLFEGQHFSGPAVLLVRTVASRQTVERCCGIAAAAGVRPEMTLAHARALLVDQPVLVERFDPSRDAAALQALARWASRFSPTVSPDAAASASRSCRPGQEAQELSAGLLLDITGCDRLFGGEAALLQRLLTAVRRLGFAARAAAAPTFGAAWAAARFGGDDMIIPAGGIADALGPLPVRGLRIDDATAEALAEVGIDRIEHVLALPRASLWARFGAGLLDRLDQAMGRLPETLDPMRPTDPPRVERTFDGPTTQYEAVELAARELVGELCRRLQQLESGARRLSLRLDRVDARRLMITLPLSRASRNAKHLWSLLRPQVEKAHLGFGIERLELTAVNWDRLRHQQAGRWRGEADDDAEMSRAAGELIDTLAARLGRDRLIRFEPTETHVPERAFAGRPAAEQPLPVGEAGRRGKVRAAGNRSTAADHASSASPRSARKSKPRRPRGESSPRPSPKGRGSGPPRIAPADRPSVLFRRPEPIEVIAMTPDGPPTWVRWRGDAGAVISTTGPERIAPAWWQLATASPPGERDYFKVIDDAGRALWVYRDAATGQWFAHGLWA